MTKILLPLVRSSASYDRLNDEVRNLEEHLQFLTRERVEKVTLYEALNQWATHHYVKYANIEDLTYDLSYLNTVIKIYITYKMVWRNEEIKFTITFDTTAAQPERSKEKEAMKVADVILAADNVNAAYGNGTHVSLYFKASNDAGRNALESLLTFRAYHKEDLYA